MRRSVICGYELYFGRTARIFFWMSSHKRIQSRVTCNPLCGSLCHYLWKIPHLPTMIRCWYHPFLISKEDRRLYTNISERSWVSCNNQCLASVLFHKGMQQTSINIGAHTYKEKTVWTQCSGNPLPPCYQGK